MPVRLSVVLLAFAAWLVAAPCQAGPARSAGRIVLSIPGGGRGPLVLTPAQGGWVGTMTVTNVGTDPLVISRVAVRGDEDDVRSPAHTGVRFVEGAATSATLAPGASKDLSVSWMPDKDPRVHQALGHVVVTSSDEDAGEVAMGFRATLPTGLGVVGEHALSLLVLLPWLVVLACAGLRAAGRGEGPEARRVAVGGAVVELLLALWVLLRFVPGVGRGDGNEGFQLVERSVWVRSVGAEWYLGVDGISVTLVPLAAALWLVALAVARVDRRPAAYHAAMALLVSGATGVLVGLDLVVVFAAWQLVLVALVMLVGGWGGARGELAGARAGVYGAVGSAALLCAFAAMSRASGATYLVDGAATAHTLAIPELARTSFAARPAIAGIPFHEAVWVMLFIGVAAATPVVPLHGWLPEALEEAPAGAGIVLVGLVTSLGPYLLVRVGLGAMPEGARWAGASIAALGVLSMAYASFCAMAQRDLRRFVAYAATASAGGALFGIASFTAHGLAGAVVGLFARGLAAALLVGAASAIERRLGTTSLAKLAGLPGEAPLLASAAALGLATSLGVPCLVGFWGPLLELLGGFARHPVLGALLAVAVVASAAAHLRVARHLLLGTFHESWRSDPALEPHRGRLPDLSSRELAALGVAAVLALLLGLWPTPLLSTATAAVADVSTLVEPPSALGP